MKIAVISDTHDHFENLNKFLDWIRQNPVQIILHCGDVVSSDFLQKILKSFKGKFFLALGNAELDIDSFENLTQKHKNFFLFENFGQMSFGKLKIAFTHFPKIAHKLALLGKYHFIFYGHTHKPWAEKINETYLINPGNLKGQPYQATFCSLDLAKKKFELILLNQI